MAKREMSEREKKLNSLLDDLNDKLDKALELKAKQQMTKRELCYKEQTDGNDD